ncbi:MAG TPA: macro domain-containing protein [Porticoccaceae bacterium]|nr:macro domain-containing protein [Porticoccaceae bacterium]
MIKEALVGNIVYSKSDAIVQGIAPDEDFSQGVALAVSQKHPGIVEDFEQYRSTATPAPGGLWAWRNGARPQVLSLFVRAASADHRGTGKLEWVDKALAELRKYVQENQLKSVALPKLGTGAGDLDWREVKPLIEKHLGDLPTRVYLYTIFNPVIEGVED